MAHRPVRRDQRAVALRNQVRRGGRFAWTGGQHGREVIQVLLPAAAVAAPAAAAAVAAEVKGLDPVAGGGELGGRRSVATRVVVVAVQEHDVPALRTLGPVEAREEPGPPGARASPSWIAMLPSSVAIAAGSAAGDCSCSPGHRPGSCTCRSSAESNGVSFRENHWPPCHGRRIRDGNGSSRLCRRGLDGAARASAQLRKPA